MKKILLLTSVVLLILSTLTGCVGNGRVQDAGIPDKSISLQILFSMGNELPDDFFSSGEIS